MKNQEKCTAALNEGDDTAADGEEKWGCILQHDEQTGNIVLQARFEIRFFRSLGIGSLCEKQQPVQRGCIMNDYRQLTLVLAQYSTRKYLREVKQLPLCLFLHTYKMSTPQFSNGKAKRTPNTLFGITSVLLFLTILWSLHAGSVVWEVKLQKPVSEQQQRQVLNVKGRVSSAFRVPAKFKLGKRFALENLERGLYDL